tara:strand:- start:5040 stop:5798 length:759 start_codon:yes stop_codon:yes gene_type:complete
MFTIKVNHVDTGRAVYKVYSKVEADDVGIKYTYWKDAIEGEYGISDDEYVAKVIKRKQYPGSNGKGKTYIRFPWGYTFFSEKLKNKKFNVKGRKTPHTISGKTCIEVQAGLDKIKKLAMVYAQVMDYDLAIDHAMGSLSSKEHIKWKRYMKTGVFKDMVREELEKLLSSHGMTKDYTITLLEDTITLAKDKRDVTNLMRAIENLQKMHGMDDKAKIKIEQGVEVSNTELIDEIGVEYDKMGFTQPAELSSGD